MRKFILISAFVLASISAHAGDSRSLVLAANDTPAATTTTTTTAPATTTTTTATEAKTEAKPETITTETAAPKKQASKSQGKQARRETDEQKARRIGAKYGVYW